MCVTKRAWHQPKGHVPILVGTLDLCQPCLCPPPGPVRTGNGLCHTGKRSACKLTTGRGGGGGGRLQRDGRGPPPPFTSMQSSLAVLGDRVANRAGAKLQPPPPPSSPRTLKPLLGAQSPPPETVPGGGRYIKISPAPRCHRPLQQGGGWGPWGHAGSGPGAAAGNIFSWGGFALRGGCPRPWIGMGVPQRGTPTKTPLIR